MMKDLHRRVTAKERKEDEHAINAENIFDSTVAAELNPIGIYLLKVNNRDTRTRCEICLKLIIKTPERRQCRCSAVFTVNFEHISHPVLVFLLLTLNM